MAWREKVTESTSTLEAQGARESPAPSGGAQSGFGAGGAAAPEGTMELVAEPGPVKKIHFEGSAPPEGESQFQVAVPAAEPESAPPRQPAFPERSNLHSIRREVDELGSPDPGFEGAPRRANLQSWRSSSTVYRTRSGGEVRAYEGPSGRTLTLASGSEERRFSEAEVDRVISGITLRQPPQEAPAEAAPQEEERSPKEKRGLFGLRRRKAKAEPDYQPQCAALTEEGAQCRNSAREGSKYCSSHFGYQPRTAQGIHQSLDTAPRFESSRDTVPGAPVAWDPSGSSQASAQCGALTREGRQCQNPTVADSPYCGSHQGYTEPTAGDIVEAADTKPRWAGAKDTKPSTRKAGKKKGRR